MKWFKFYGQDFLTDSKLGALNPLQRLMWVGLLCVASQDENRTGVIKFLTETRLKELCGIIDDPSTDDNDRTDETLVTFCNMGLVTMPDKDTIVVINFQKKQTQQTTSTERVSAWRARSRAKKGQKRDVTNVTLQSNNVTLHSNGRVDKSRVDKNIYNTNTTTSVASAAGDGINAIIDLFKDVNPSFAKLFRITTQRKAVERLLKLHGPDKLQKVIEILPKTNASQYAPTITTPLNLEDKWAQLGIFVRKQQNKPSGVIKI